jgi:hypothetical protein
MFMMNPMMYSAMMYNPMMYGAMYAPMMSANTPSYFQQKYGCGPEDFANRPFVKANPKGVLSCYVTQPAIKDDETGGTIARAFKSYFA